jgi:hypothetical protein
VHTTPPNFICRVEQRIQGIAKVVGGAAVDQEVLFDGIGIGPQRLNGVGRGFHNSFECFGKLWL